MKVSGRVVSGLGEGEKFFSLEQYLRGFEKLLGKKPFFGTLNVDAGAQNILICDKIKKNANLVLRGFEVEGREYFEVKCIRAKLEGVEGLIVFPKISHHPINILEFVCHENLREKFGILDGTIVEIEIK